MSMKYNIRYRIVKITWRSLWRWNALKSHPKNSKNSNSFNCFHTWKAWHKNQLDSGWQRCRVLAREHVSLLHLAHRGQELLQPRCHGWPSGPMIKLFHPWHFWLFVVVSAYVCIWNSWFSIDWLGWIDFDLQAFVEAGGEADLDVYRAVLRFLK